MTYKKPENVPGLIRNEDGSILEYYASDVPEGMCIIEIGPFTGKSTAFIARGAEPGVKIYTIDPWDMLDVPISGTGLTIATDRARAEVLFHDNMQKCGLKDKVVAVKSFSSDAAAKWAGTIEIGMIYIDGNHKYPGVKADIEDWLPKVAVRGVAIFDDYRSTAGVRRAVDEFLASHGPTSNSHWIRCDRDDTRFVVLQRES